MSAAVGDNQSRRNFRSCLNSAVQSMFLTVLFLLFLPLLALIAEGADSSTQALGFHANSASSASRKKTCNDIEHPIFEELSAVLHRETGNLDFHLQLRSCPDGDFFAHTRRGDVYGRIFYVDMPETHQLSADALGAVFAHELYHVFQFLRFGSFPEVMAHYGHRLKSAELAADFGAGYLLSKTNLPNLYEMNTALSGGFRLTGDDSHGSPAERSMAFRQGFYFIRAVSPAYSMESAEAHFREFSLR